MTIFQKVSHRLVSLLFILVASIPGASAANAPVIAGIVPVPAIPGRPASPHYTVTVNGKTVAVNDESRYDFQTAAFCMSGTATIKVGMTGGATGVEVHPLRHNLKPVIEGDSATFTLSEPFNLVVTAPGRPPLALIATPLETAIPRELDSNVLYFGPGVHNPGVIHPRSGQTIYLAPGALVKGRIEAKDVKNVTVKGRGILDSSAHSIRNQKTHGILFERSSNIRVEGIGHRGGSWWQVLFLLTDNAEVSHMNLLGKEVNTDGIDIDGVRNFVARDSFIRCGDDGFGWHALDARANGEAPTENCLADNCVIWNTTAGNGLRIGASMETQLFQNITFRNIDVLMHKNAAICSDHSDWAWCKNIRFENFVDETTAQTVLIVIAKTRYSNDNNYRDERGHFEGLYFDRLVSPGGGIKLIGADASHLIDHVTFRNCAIAGKPVASLQDLVVNPFVTNVTFENK